MRKNITEAGWAASNLIDSLEKRGDETALEELWHTALGALASLQRLSNGGNEAAAMLLARTLIDSTHGLYENLDKQLEIYRGLARKNQIFPGFITVDKDWEKMNTKAKAYLHLGEKAPYNYTGKQWTRDTPEVSAALELHKLLKKNKSLPPFNRGTAKQWWKAARKIFERVFGKEFEKHPLFAKKYGSKKQPDASLHRNTWQRQQILSKMEQAFRSIAPKV